LHTPADPAVCACLHHILPAAGDVLAKITCEAGHNSYPAA